MRLEDLNFHLPAAQIANDPAVVRDASRLLHVDKNAGKFEDRSFQDISSLLRSGDTLVVNNTRVFPARLFGSLETGAKIEVLLEEEIASNTWRALAKPGKRLKQGKQIKFDDRLAAEVADRTDDGRVILAFDPSIDLWPELDRVGKTPLPHYITRNEHESAADRDRYQTIYASERGAIAAPTAGLHFTPEVMSSIRDAGVSIVEITLHVGYGTFEPVRVDDIREHKVLPERIEISQLAADALNGAKQKGGRIVAVGTTTTRALESAIDDAGIFKAQNFRTSLTVTPGYRFRAVDALLTNFHLPKSSLLILVSTFGGHELIMKAYDHAVNSGYRFYSYGDCMFIE